MNDDFRPLHPRTHAERIKPRPHAEGIRPFQPPGHTPGTLPTPQADHTEGPPPKLHHDPKWKFWKHWHNLSKKQKIILASAAAGLLIASGLIWWFVFRDKPAPPAPIAKEEIQAPEPPPPTTVASPLTGVQVTPDLAKLPVTGIMIENSPDARPQSGLVDAGVVYEAIAEGGITRFLTLFQESRPGYIGPVRSVRPYYLDFLAPYDAPIAHAGGSAQALAEIRAQGIKDLDHGANAGAYQRVSNRFAPHNLYTNRDALLGIHNARGWNTSNFTGFPRKADQPSTTPPNARTVDLTISAPLYNPHFDYDAPSNSYVRSMGGKPHVDEKSGKQINPKVIVVIVTSHRYAGIYSVYGVTGTGQAYIIQDGNLTQGVWEKTDRKSQYKFGDANGAPLALNAGQTWITLVSSPSAVKHGP